MPLALCAIGGFTLVFIGCNRVSEESAAAVEPAKHTPESYMKDPAFRGQLKELRTERNALAKARSTVVAKMEAMIEAKKAELKTDDLEKVRAELEKDPEWKSLYKRCLDANQAIEDNQKHTFGIVRERLTPADVKKPAGEQKPAEGTISK